MDCVRPASAPDASAERAPAASVPCARAVGEARNVLEALSRASGAGDMLAGSMR